MNDPIDSRPASEPAIKLGTLATYALPAAPVQFFYLLLLLMYLKFAADSLGASPAVVGTIFLVAKVWDAVSDPMVGNLSDNTRSRLGRRRSWLLGSALPLLFFGVMSWSPPEGLSGFSLNAWIAVSVIGFYTAYTAFDVPHMALGAEISLESRDRTRIFGARQLSRAFGMLAAAAGTQLLIDDESGRSFAFWLALGAGLVAVASIVFSVFRLPEEREDFMGRGGQNPFRAIRDVWANPHARLLLFVFFIESLGAGAIGVLVPFALDYVLEMPELTGPMLGFVFVLGMASVPMWVALARRYEKRRLWLGAMLMSGFGFAMLIPLGKGDWQLMAFSSLFVGLASSCGAVIGQSIKAEIIDYDEYLTGERKEGAYFAAWSFMGKLAAGIMVFVVGVVLENVGYVPNVPQTEAVKGWMVFLMGGLPLIGYGIGAAAFLRFRFSESEHAKIRAALDARASEASG